MTSEIQLSRIHPDYAQIRAQLQLALSSTDSWKDLLTTSTGQAVIDFISAIGDLDQYSIEHSYKEAFLDGRQDSSIYAIAKLLGIRLGRKTPAQATVTLSRTTNVLGTLTIPAYTEFSGGGVPMFNRTPIVFNIGVTSVNAELFQGTIRTLTAMSDGTDYQIFMAEERDYQVSDIDTQVMAGSVEIPIIRSGLWTKRGEPAVQDLTFNRGEMVLMFGNNLFGYKPGVNTPLTFRYVVTTGLAANSLTFSGQSVSAPTVPGLTGVAITGLAAGADQRDASFYRKFGPQLFSAGERANTEQEYQAIAANYPSVIDALVVGQRKLTPYDLRFMNLVRISLLRNTTWGQPQIDDFTAYYQARTMFPVRFYFEDPIAVDIDLEANVYCRVDGDLTTIQSSVTAALQELFKPRVGIIGLNFYRSDIHRAIRLASPNVEFIELLNPLTDIFPMFEAPRPPKVTVIPGGGTLGVGPVAYAVTVITPTGQTLANNIGTNVVTANGSGVQLEWNAVPGALGYKVYGRTFPGAKLIATFGPDVTTFNDVGFELTATDPPAFDSSGVRYCRLREVKLNMYHTDRRLK